ncbi:tdp2, partial [Symbiodinium sp. KB8]
MTQSRLLPTVLLAASSWLLISLLGSQQTTFLTGTSPAGSSRQSRTAMRGFKDDFYAWKDSLSKDEQALLLKQAQNEFDKKFRKSDEFSQDLPEEKIQSFAKVLKKFFDN